MINRSGTRRRSVGDRWKYALRRHKDKIGIADNSGRRPAKVESTEAVSSINTAGLGQILLLGAAGALGRKLTPFCKRLREGRTKIYAADIVSETDFRPDFAGFSGYFNMRRNTDREKLFNLGRKDKFRVCYDATWPDARLFNIVRWAPICDHLVSTKPLTAVKHFESLKTLVVTPPESTLDERQSTGEILNGAFAYEDVVRKLSGHDHYINKPALDAVLTGLSELHTQFGGFFHVTIVIMEQRDINDPEEQIRIRALDEGMIPDLDAHGVMIIQRLTPEGLVWRDGNGHLIKRISRQIAPTACVRAQMRNAMCQGDTACIAEYMVTENLCLVDGDQKPIGRPVPRTFFALVACGKGFRAETYVDRDLKAVEIAFQGQGKSTGIVDLDTNQVNEVLASGLGPTIPGPELRIHRGINLPMYTLVDKWPQFCGGPILRKQLFQSVPLLYENMRILRDTINLTNTRGLPAHDPGELVHQFVNMHVSPSNGFRFFGGPGSGWPTRDAPMNLMIGKPAPHKVD